MKKVLFIIWSFSCGGGAEKILSNIVNNLDKDKYSIEILEYYHTNIKEETVNQNIVVHKPIIDTTKNGLYYRIRRMIIEHILINYFPKLLRKIVLNKTYDVEVSFNYMIPTFLLNEKSSKLISWFHGSIENLKGKQNLIRKQRRYLEPVDYIVPISKKTEESIMYFYPEFQSKINIIYNGFDIDKAASYNFDDTVEKFDILYCTRMDENKNPVLFIDIMKKIIDLKPDLKVYMLGSGVLEKEVMDKINAYNISENVVIKGYVKEPYNFFNKCRLYCLTSTAEGFPTVIVESMMFGKPFVTTPVAGSEELSNDGKCGLIANDIDDYVCKVYELLTDIELYKKMSDNCYEHVKEFTLKKQIESIEKMIN